MKPRKNERGMGAIYLPKVRRRNGELRETGVWWMSYSHGGKRVRESTELTSKTAALDLLAVRKAACAKGEAIPEGGKKLRYERLCDLIRADYKENGLRSPHSLECVLNRLTKHFARWTARKSRPTLLVHTERCACSPAKRLRRSTASYPHCADASRWLASADWSRPCRSSKP